MLLLQLDQPGPHIFCPSSSCHGIIRCSVCHFAQAQCEKEGTSVREWTRDSASTVWEPASECQNFWHVRKLIRPSHRRSRAGDRSLLLSLHAKQCLKLDKAEICPDSTESPAAKNWVKNTQYIFWQKKGWRLYCNYSLEYHKSTLK